MQNPKKDKYNLKIDNEIKKKELEDQYGASFINSSNIPPELESEWLKSVDEFEQQFKKQKTIPVWQYIGKPEYRKVSEIEPENISTELQRIIEIMDENNVDLETLCEVEEEEIYRFITDELFNHEMDDMRIEGMRSVFTYEEFHPNAEYDIEQAFDYLFMFTFGKDKNIDRTGYDMLYVDLDNFKNSKGKLIDKNQALKRFNNFLDSFDYFNIVSKEIKNLTVNEKKTDSKLSFKIHYTGHFNNSPERIEFKGDGKMKLKPSEYGGWEIYHLVMPGLEF